jgi:hypothetical protein
MAAATLVGFKELAPAKMLTPDLAERRIVYNCPVLRFLGLAAITVLVNPLWAVAADETYGPITPSGRLEWIVDGTVGARSLGVGVIAAAWQTGLNSPDEWDRSWSGLGKRYAEREADVAISNSIEAGLGAWWGEEPRYIRSGRGRIAPRMRYALRTVLLAQRRDGHLAPAWGRYAGNVFNNVIENAWLPPSATTWQATAVRSANGFLSRAAGNLWEEFWPDLRRRVFRR